MKVLDSSFLIDYETGEPEAAAFLQDNADEEFIIPSTVYTEYLLGEANAAPDPDLPALRAQSSSSLARSAHRSSPANPTSRTTLSATG